MDCAVTMSCQLRVNCGSGFPSLISRLLRRKKRKFVDAATQTDEDLIEMWAAKKWGERINGQHSSTRVAPPPPPPERRRGMHSAQPTQDKNKTVGPFAPTVDELKQGRASLRPVNRKLTSSGSVPPATPSLKAQPPPKSASLPDNNSPMSIDLTGDSREVH